MSRSEDQRRTSGHANLDGVKLLDRAADRLAAVRRLDRHSFRPGSWQDVALAGFLCAAFPVEFAAEPGQDFSPRALAAGAVVLVSLAATLWRPRLGDAYLALALGCWVVAAALFNGLGADFAVVVGIYTSATRHSWRETAVAVGVAVAAAALVAILEGKTGDLLTALDDLLAQLALYAAVALLGLYMRRRRAYVRTLVDRAEDLEREREMLEREHDLMTRQAVAVERARIARELHDVVAHHVSVMVIQAGAAQASLPPDAAASSQAIEAVGQTGREAMAELRRMLGLLRSEASFEPGSDATDGLTAEAGRAPQPGLSDLAGLADRTRDAGVEVAIEIVGDARPLPAGVDLSVYRVAQEALTNTLRHSGPGTQARVRVAFEPEAVVVEVTDDGRDRRFGPLEPARSAVGHGLVGMRERATLYGGRLEAGPLPGGGFRVMARFPFDPAPQNGGEG